MNQIHILSVAHRDFLSVVDAYIAVNIDLATSFVEEVETAYRLIDSAPRRFPMLETNLTDREIRRITLERFPYVVVYEISQGAPVVIAIQHTSQHPDFWRRNSMED